MPQPHVHPTAGAPAPSHRHPPPWPIQAIALVVAVVVAALLSMRGNLPPAPVGQDAAATSFSSQRAQAVLTRILGDERPHPTGSQANAEVRDRIVAEFARLGLVAEVQRRFACGTSTCATVENIVARVPGTRQDHAVLLSAHYDSVAAGPGASDDGAGVAALLEVTRALQAGPALPRDVWLLANDGEELDLLGAEAFVREPAFTNIASVVNLEARGTTGASLLIETQPGNAAVVAAVGRALTRPAGTSLDYEIYKTLPNDTDFTVFRREGRAGTNFAWAQGAARYHTPLDDLAHLDPASLQHHGDNLLAMARAFAAAPGNMKRSNDAVFFGLSDQAMLSWPAPWNPALLLLGLAGWMLLWVRLVRGQQVRTPRAVGAGIALMLALAVVAALGFALHALLGALGATPATWTAQGTSLVATFGSLAVATMTALAVMLSRRFSAAEIALASLLPFALMAMAAVVAMPGASHVGLLPLIAGSLAGHVWSATGAMGRHCLGRCDPAVVSVRRRQLRRDRPFGPADRHIADGIAAAAVVAGDCRAWTWCEMAGRHRTLLHARVRRTCGVTPCVRRRRAATRQPGLRECRQRGACVRWSARAAAGIPA